MNYENLEHEFLQYASIVKLTEGQEMAGAEIIAAVTAIRAGVDVFKGVKDLNTKVANLELDRAIHSMDRALFELEKELLTKEKENELLKQQIKQLTNPKTNPKIFKLGVLTKDYWYSETDVDNPVCSACYDSLGKIIRLVPTDRSTKMSTKHKYQCPNCKTTS